MKEVIEKFDQVTVIFGDGYSLQNCVVLYVPSQSGEAWVLKNKEQELIYVQQYQMIKQCYRQLLEYLQELF